MNPNQNPRSPPKIVIGRDCVINMDQHSYQAHMLGKWPQHKPNVDRAFQDRPNVDRANLEKSNRDRTNLERSQMDRTYVDRGLSSERDRSIKKRPMESPVPDDGMYISDYTTEDDSIEQLIEGEISDSDTDDEVKEQLEDADDSFQKDDVFARSFENEDYMRIKVPQGGGDIYELVVDDVLEEDLGDISSDDSEGSTSLRSTDGSIDDILDNVPGEMFSGDATLGRVFSLRRERHLDMEIDSSTESDQINNKERISKVAASQKQQMSVYKNYTVYETVQTTSIVHGQKSSSLKSKNTANQVLAIESNHQESETIQEAKMSPVDTLFSHLSQNDKDKKQDRSGFCVQFSSDNGSDKVFDDQNNDQRVPYDQSKDPRLQSSQSFDEPDSTDELDFRSPSPEILFEKVVEDMSDFEAASSEDWDTGEGVHTDGEDTVDVMIDADEDEDSESDVKVKMAMNWNNQYRDSGAESHEMINWNKRYDDVVKEVRLRLSQTSQNSSTECIGEDRTVSVSSLDQPQYGSERSYNSSVQTSDSEGGGSAHSRDEEDYEQPFAEIINETKMLTQSIMSAFAALTEHDESITFSDLVNTTVTDSDMDSSVVSAGSKEPNTPELHKDNWVMEDYKQSTSKYFINDVNITASSNEWDTKQPHGMVSASNQNEQFSNNEISATTHQNLHHQGSTQTHTSTTHQTTTQQTSTTYHQQQQSESIHHGTAITSTHHQAKQCASPDKEIFVPTVYTDYESTDESGTEYSVVSTNEWLSSNSLPRLKQRVPSEPKLSKSEQKLSKTTPTSSSSSLNPPLLPLTPVAAKIQKIRLVSLPDHEFQQKKRRVDERFPGGQTADATVIVESSKSYSQHEVQKQTYSQSEEHLYKHRAHRSFSSLGSDRWESEDVGLSQMSTVELPERNNRKSELSHKPNIDPLTVTRVDTTTNIILSPTVKEAIYFEDYIDSCPAPDYRDSVEVISTTQSTESANDVTVAQVPSEGALSYHVHDVGNASCETGPNSQPVEIRLRYK